MRYIKINRYTYADKPNDETLYFGQDEHGRFIHQLIEDRNMPHDKPLDDAVALTNDVTSEFTSDYDFEVSFGDVEHMTIDGHDFALCRQEMSFADGDWAVQVNAYFFDPADGVFRMTQFGTMPVSAEEKKANGDAYRDYVELCMKRLLADMNIPEDVVQFRIPAFTAQKV